MIFIKKSAFLALLLAFVLVCAGQANAAKTAALPAQSETTLDVKAKLDAFAKGYVSQANKSLQNNRQRVAVTKEKGKYVARFSEVDPDTLTTEIYPGKGPKCQYVGHIVYLEKVYECIGDSQNAAKSGEFKQARARRVRELTRYDGSKWIY